MEVVVFVIRIYPLTAVPAVTRAKLSQEAAIWVKKRRMSFVVLTIHPELSYTVYVI